MVAVNASPVESAAYLPKFCKSCGRRMVIGEVTTGFREDTGQPVLAAEARCNGSWLDRLLGNTAYHDWYIVSPRPKFGGR